MEAIERIEVSVTSSTPPEPGWIRRDPEDLESAPESVEEYRRRGSGGGILRQLAAEDKGDLRLAPVSEAPVRVDLMRRRPDNSNGCHMVMGEDTRDDSLPWDRPRQPGATEARSKATAEKPRWVPRVLFDRGSRRLVVVLRVADDQEAPGAPDTPRSRTVSAAETQVEPVVLVAPFGARVRRVVDHQELDPGKTVA